MAKGAQLAVRCADLASYSWELDEESVTVGGCVRSMAWDPLGERLSVVFKGVCILGQGKGYSPPSTDAGLSIHYANV